MSDAPAAAGEGGGAPAFEGAGSGGRFAFLAGAGILASRVLGLVRQRVFAHYLGSLPAADAFQAAFRIPNLLQNLFGEGSLSASFIPVYAGLLARGDAAAARRLAGAAAALAALAVAVLVLLGILLAPVLVAVLAPGFLDDPRRELTVRLVRVLFPGAGLLVLSAWCLGILNSHRRFFLPYAAPVVWNLAMIGTLLGFGGRVPSERLVVLLAWGSVGGSALQVFVQLPAVLRLTGALRLSIAGGGEHLRMVLRSFGPVFIGRGVVQISAFVDTIVASLLPTGAVAALAYAQAIYVLPVSLFGMSVAAAELPSMSSAIGTPEEVSVQLRGRLEAGLRRIAFFVVPSAVAFLALGDVIVAAIYFTGEFGRAEVVWVWAILAGAAVGLLAATLGRLYSSAFYALHDTRTPLRYATLRIGLALALGLLLGLVAPPLLGMDPRWGVAGLTAGGGLAAWAELGMLRRTLGRRIGRTTVRAGYVARLWFAALVAAALAWLLRAPVGLLVTTHVTPTLHAIAAGVLLLGAYGFAYVGLAILLRVPEARLVGMRQGGSHRRR